MVSLTTHSFPGTSEFSTSEKSAPARQRLYDVDPECMKQWLKAESEKNRETNGVLKKKYGFDFDCGTPCTSTPSEFVYTAVPASLMPRFYHCTRCRESISSPEEQFRMTVPPSSPVVVPKHAKLPATPRKQAKITLYLRVEKKRIGRPAKKVGSCRAKVPSKSASRVLRPLKSAMN